MAVNRAALKQLIIFSLDVAKTQDFFTDILNLRLLHSTATFSELADASNLRFLIRQAPTIAHASTGFSPLLCFHVHDLQ